MHFASSYGGLHFGNPPYSLFIKYGALITPSNPNKLIADMRPAYGGMLTRNRLMGCLPFVCRHGKK
jgi:hypothetical protein